MIPQNQRLQKEKDISAVLSQKVGVFDDVCGVRLSKNGGTGVRVAFSVGKKVSSLAVVRNRIRRQFRALYCETRDQWPKGFDYVFLIGKPASTLSYEQKRAQFQVVLGKVQKRLA